MNSKLRLSMISLTAAGLMGVAALMGASTASAATTATTVSASPATSVIAPRQTPGTVGTTTPQTPRTSQTPQTPNSQDTRKPAATKHARNLARVRAAVLAKYPNATISSITENGSGGWTVTLVTAKGRQATVTVDSRFQVGRLVLAPAHRHAV